MRAVKYGAREKQRFLMRAFLATSLFALRRNRAGGTRRALATTMLAFLALLHVFMRGGLR